jgi:phosphinothricin acetyltransferase
VSTDAPLLELLLVEVTADQATRHPSPRQFGPDRPYGGRVSVALRVREADPADAEAISEIYRPHVERTLVSFEVDAPDAAEMARRMSASPLHPWLVAVGDAGGAGAGAGDSVAGYAYATPHRARAGYRWSIDTSVYVSEPGRGIGTELMRSLLDLCASRGFVQAYAGVALPNDASIALHRSLGFREVGVYRAVGFKFGRWVDVAWWQRSLVDPLPVPPAEPGAAG